MPIELTIAMILMAVSIGAMIMSPEVPLYIVVLLVLSLFLMMVGAFDGLEVIDHVVD